LKATTTSKSIPKTLSCPRDFKTTYLFIIHTSNKRPPLEEEKSMQRDNNYWQYIHNIYDYCNWNPFLFIVRAKRIEPWLAKRSHTHTHTHTRINLCAQQQANNNKLSKNWYVARKEPKPPPNSLKSSSRLVTRMLGF
jgi:hypothetical protein